MSEPVNALELAGISSGYGEALVVRDVAFHIREGEIFALLGKNGMGKTTLLKTIMGFLTKQAGTVRLFGEDVTGLPPHRIARKSITYAPQEQALFQDLSVEDNLRLGLRNDGLLKAGMERVATFFPFLRERMDQRAGTLSGGEQKMLLIARTLMSRPRLVLVDEITEGLQPSVVEKLVGVLRSERDIARTAILLVEQNVGFAMEVASRYAVLKLGEIVDQGLVDDNGTRERISAQLSV
jgi:branched-chain amino acid transport system ATP-binding protein